MNKFFLVFIGLTVGLTLFSQEYHFRNNNIVAELNINVEVLKKIEKNSVLTLKITSDLTETQFKEWLASGKNHYNVASIVIEKGTKQGEFNMTTTFKDGLDYATGKELFSSALYIDFFILNGEKLALNEFVSQHLSYK